MLGCGPQLALTAPSLFRRSVRSVRRGPASAASESWLLRLALAAISAYQGEISPCRAPCCRYSPTCSHYAAEALRVHGLARGTWLTARRLVRCRPGSGGGPDPVPVRGPQR
ncbi:MAG: membrane protein insertion efficiency factor YidD [Pseudonocardiales bacterium]